MSDQEAYDKAKKKVEAKIGFFIHLVVYIGVNALLVVINFATLDKVTPYYWFIWPLLGWGIGVVFHGIMAFFLAGETSLTERMIEKEMKKGNPDKG